MTESLYVNERVSAGGMGRVKVNVLSSDCDSGSIIRQTRSIGDYFENE